MPNLTGEYILNGGQFKKTYNPIWVIQYRERERDMQRGQE
jgi:hypothetical protein